MPNRTDLKSKLLSFIDSYSHVLLVTMLAGLLAVIPGEALALTDGQEGSSNYVIIGTLVDQQGVPVVDVSVKAFSIDGTELLGETESQEDGTWRLALIQSPAGELQIKIEHPRYIPQTLNLSVHDLENLNDVGIYRLGETSLDWEINAGFWAATLIFLGVILLIAFEKLHSITAALTGFSALFLVSYVG